MTDAKILFSRQTRQAILSVLKNVSDTGLDVFTSTHALTTGLVKSKIDVTCEMVRATLNDLRHDTLIERGEMEYDGPFGYRLTSKGRDFVVAGFPWSAVDEFTGGK